MFGTSSLNQASKVKSLDSRSLPALCFSFTDTWLPFCSRNRGAEASLPDCVDEAFEMASGSTVAWVR